MPRLPALPALLALAACAGSQAPSRPGTQHGTSAAAHVPDFATRPYVPFSRADAIGLALAAWREFGSEVHDEPPSSTYPIPPSRRPDRQPGLWEQVGLYWWLGQDAGTRESYWTGAQDGFGSPLPDADIQPWSAAFISYVMRIAGAGPRFPYSGSHSRYIDIGKEMATGQTSGYVVLAKPPQSYAPQPGDLICTGRDAAERLRYDDLPRPDFAAHCDIVVQASKGLLNVIGGNVAYSVSMKHVPTSPAGTIAAPDGTSLDPRYPWFVVLQILYDQ